MSAASSAALAVEGISKSFRLGRESFQALRGIDLALAAGEFVSVVGPSGCGKSTLLRIIAGLETPDAGRVTIGSSTPAETTAAHRLGIAFQDHALLPWLSVAENIALPYRLAGMTVDQARVQELARLVGLGDFLRARPRQLSGGMRQRVSIARAMVLKPVVLLLDEPFGALDLVTRRHLNLEMQRIWGELGTTALLITHSVDEAVQFGNRVFVMAARPGRMHAEFAVKLPRPRDRRVTASPEFVALVQKVAAALDDATAASTASGMPG
ncbi:MAG: ABC transporter ATP-binding protein [Alphaproteobacteria bacterium]|nr:ABC transporter ATP-binding protein [Alphaproteobacteria bacterium]